MSIFLVRNGQEDTARSLLPLASQEQLRITDVDEALYAPLDTPTNTPEWFTALATLLPADGTRTPLRTHQAAALIFCRTGNRSFLIAFGTAHARIPEDIVEAHFGRRVAMGVVPTGKVIELKAHQVFAAFHRLSERAPGATGHRRFGVDGDRDLLGVIEGIAEPSPSPLGQRVRGGTSLKIEIAPEDLPAALQSALHHYTAPSQHTDWSELDNLTPVLDAATLTQLNAQLDTFLSNKPNTLTLATPGGDAFRGANQFRIGRWGPNVALSPSLLHGSFYAQLGSNPATTASAKSTPVHCVDADGIKLDIKTNVYQCICHETQYAGRTYVLWSGNWYESSVNFKSRISASITGLASRTPQATLPRWNQTEHEADYNRRASTANGFKLLDKHNTHFGGNYSKFEHCDVVHEASKTLYFVKIYSSSSTMSHLVEQVRRTSELFFSPDSAYRTAMKNAGHNVPNTRPKPGEWTLCLVVLGRAFCDLPFFAQCGLARLVRELDNGYHTVAGQAA